MLAKEFRDFFQAQALVLGYEGEDDILAFDDYIDS